MTDSNASDTPRGRPFTRGKSGNPAGRPLGARNRATLAAETLLAGEAEALTRKAIELALIGDINALRLCLDRLIPPRREQPVDIEVRKLESIDDAKYAVADIIAAAAAGEITLSGAAELVRLIEVYVKIAESKVGGGMTLEQLVLRATARRHGLNTSIEDI
jgi:hypothetical protein